MHATPGKADQQAQPANACLREVSEESADKAGPDDRPRGGYRLERGRRRKAAQPVDDAMRVRSDRIARGAGSSSTILAKYSSQRRRSLENSICGAAASAGKLFLRMCSLALR